MPRFLSRRTFSVLALVAAATLGFANTAQAADEAADAFIKRVSSDILDAIKADKSIHNGDVNKIIILVDQRVMPNVNFLRMTASAVGPAGVKPPLSSKNACKKNSKFCWCAHIQVLWVK